MHSVSAVPSERAGLQALLVRRVDPLCRLLVVGAAPNRQEPRPGPNLRRAVHRALHKVPVLIARPRPDRSPLVLDREPVPGATNLARRHDLAGVGPKAVPLLETIGAGPRVARTTDGVRRVTGHVHLGVEHRAGPDR